MNKNSIILWVLIAVCFITACKSLPTNKSELSKIDVLIEQLNNAADNQVLVAAHRADWRNAPENSLPAIASAIKLGVDIVEIDIRETKDGQLVLMHDESIDRTTSGKGLVKDWTLDSLKTLSLKDGLGTLTQHKIPTLEEALIETKGKVLVNLDKSYPIIDKCYQITEKTETTKQIIVKGKETYQTLKNDFGYYLDKMYYMPIVNLPKENAETIVNDYLNNLKPVAFEFTVASDTVALLKKFKDIRKQGSSIWVNSLWPQHNAGHDDEKAFTDLSVYDWFINNNIDIIQTDRPELLLKYLRNKGLHN